MKIGDIKDLTERAAKRRLEELITFLDEKDQDDFFGTEGWRHDIGWED